MPLSNQFSTKAIKALENILDANGNIVITATSADISGNVTVGGTLDVTGATTVTTLKITTGALVNGTLISDASGNLTFVKNNLTATVVPTVNDDTTQGYSATSMWYDSVLSEYYRCMDASTGAAVWEKTTLTLDDLGSIVTQDSNAIAITGGTIEGTAIGGVTPAAGAFTTLDTGQGANELYDMDQNVQTTDTPTFAGATFTDDVTISGTLGVTGALTADGLAYPTTDGGAGQYMQTNGSGTLTFAGGAGGGDVLADGSVPITGTLTGTFQSSYGVSWNESADTYARTGSLAGQAVSGTLAAALLPIQASMRRCVISNSGEVQYYLGATDSYNRVGMSPSITGTDDAGAAGKVSQAVIATGTDDTGTASKVSDVGVFTSAESVYVDKYVHNTSDDTYARITAKDSDDVLSIISDIMDIGETFNIGVLSQPAANYVGRYVHNTTDDTYSMITAKDSDAALSIDADILDSAETFDICTAVLDGTDGHQVMVQIPAFYYKYGYSGTTHTYEISMFPESGFSLHPAFIKNGVPVAYRYIGAYEGIGWDNSVSAYIDNTNVAATGWSGTTIDTVNDILSSVSGKNPVTDETRNEFRLIAANRGTGWRQLDYDLVSAIQLLYLIEYADWNSQAMIGAGRTALSGGTWVKDSYIGVTGKSNGDGNGTFSVAGNTNDAYMTYRGIENFFGNVWKWVDGLNVNDNVPYVSNTDTNFADDTATNYTALGITLANANGYVILLEQQPRGFLPASVGGSLSTYITDYYYQAAGWRVGRLGGLASCGAEAGFAFWHLDGASSLDGATIGGRLAF